MSEENETPVAENGSSEPKSSSPEPKAKRERSSSERDNRRGGKDRRDRDRDRRYQPYGREGRGGGGGRGPRGHGQDPERTVYISNIPYEMKWQDIKDLFRDKVGEVTYVEMFTDMDGKSRGCGIVEFKDKDAAKKAVDNLHKHSINGRAIIVREDSSGELQRRARIKNNQDMPGGDIGGGPMGGMGGGMGNMGGGMGNMGGGMGNMGGGMGNMGGGMGNMGGGMGNMGGGMGNMGGGMGGGMGGNSNVDPDLMRRLNNGDISNVVFVANLDYKVTWKKLKDIFKMAGNVLRAEIKTDNEGKSRGHGTVTFEFPLEAAQAISMFNGQKLFDRTMVVRPDSKSPGDMGRDPGPKLPSGLSGIGAGLGPGGQPLNVQQMGSGGGGGGNMGGGMGGGGMGGGMGGGLGGGLGMGGNMGGGMGNMGGMSDLGGGMGGMGGGMGNMGRGGLGMGDLGGGGGMGMGGGMGNLGDSMGNMGGGMASPGMGGMGGGFGGGMSGGTMGGMGGMRVGNPMSGGMGGGMGGGGGMMGGGMDNNMGRGMGNRNQSCQIFVRNLPWSMNWQNLKEKFKICGRVMYAEIKMENGKSKGCGTVRFESPDGAQRACDMMNGIKLDGREIDVRLDRSA